MLCSSPVDDMTSHVRWKDVDDTLAYAERTNAVALFHAHVPGETITTDAIASLLILAEQHHLDFVRYDELDPAQPPRAGIALAFDDQATDKWVELRDLFAAHGARVTFYITRFPNYTDEMKAQVAELAADGHDIEAHSITHPLAPDYVAAHGLSAYLADEVVPSFQLLRDAGYTPTSYAFPFGHASEETYAATLALDGVARIRLSPGNCPY